MVSIKFKCSHCDKIVAQDGFIANCEHCGGVIDFEIQIKQYDYNDNTGESDNVE